MFLPEFLFNNAVDENTTERDEDLSVLKSIVGPRSPVEDISRGHKNTNYEASNYDKTIVLYKPVFPHLPLLYTSLILDWFLFCLLTRVPAIAVSNKFGN